MTLEAITAIHSIPAFLAINTLGGIIWTALIGVVTGVLAKFLSGDREPTGCLITMLIGVVGAFVALYLGRAIGWYKEGDSPGLIASVIGAIILLAIYHLITRRTGGPKI